MPTYHLKKSHLDFNLVHFEDFLRGEKYNFGDRNDLRKSILGLYIVEQRLKARRLNDVRGYDW